ncbi:hypothetical protein KUCAC02_034269, partial [Chaenocephalus aceratus]
ASSIALTTDGWTSRATESYLTVTAHYITPDCNWNMQSHVLQTRPLYEQHTSTNLAEVLKEVVSEWKLERPAQQLHICKQEMLNVPKHKLIHDVPTRWNSSYDMVERYIEQQAAVYSALTEKALKKNKNINTLSDQDDFLHKCTAVDPRFKALSHVDNACREHIYNSLTTEIVAIEEQREATETAGAMKSAMAELFGKLFNTEERNKPTLQLVKGEVTSYMAADSTSLDSDPLACTYVQQTG